MKRISLVEESMMMLRVFVILNPRQPLLLCVREHSAYGKGLLDIGKLLCTCTQLAAVDHGSAIIALNLTILTLQSLPPISAHINSLSAND